jgi:hypothetical protein
LKPRIQKQAIIVINISFNKIQINARNCGASMTLNICECNETNVVSGINPDEVTKSGMQSICIKK